MVDQASRVKDHKEHIVKVDEFVTRIAKEFESLVEARHAEKPKAKGEYIQLYDEGENYVDKFKEVSIIFICRPSISAKSGLSHWSTKL